MTRVALFTDADNTLWGTDAVFARAQLELLRSIESALGSSPSGDRRALAFLRQIDQLIARSHPDDLRYPPALLAEGISIALGGATPGDAVRRAMTSTPRRLVRYRDLIEVFSERLKSVPRLRIGVRATLRFARLHAIPVVVVSEANYSRCESLIRSHRLEHHVEAVVCEKKTSALYHRLREQFPSRRAVMVGDQIDRDVVPAIAAGFETALFPSAFRPFWVGSDGVKFDYSIRRYDDLKSILNRDAAADVRR